MSAFIICAMPLFLEHSTHVVQEKPGKSVTITPTEFFSGELKRLEHHVDFRAWCFKFDPPGFFRCRPMLEMWCDGKRVDKPKYGIGEHNSENELTLSLRAEMVKEQLVFSLQTGGMFPTGRRFDKPKSTQKINVEFGPVSIEKPIQLKKGESEIIWAMGAGHEVALGKPENVEKMLKTAPWVLIMRLTVE